MLTTEEKYVEDLSHMVEGYMEPMLQHPDPGVNELAESVRFILRSFFFWSHMEDKSFNTK
jgi:hypothetical protein